MFLIVLLSLLPLSRLLANPKNSSVENCCLCPKSFCTTAGKPCKSKQTNQEACVASKSLSPRSQPAPLLSSSSSLASAASSQPRQLQMPQLLQTTHRADQQELQSSLASEMRDENVRQHLQQMTIVKRKLPQQKEATPAAKVPRTMHCSSVLSSSSPAQLSIPPTQSLQRHSDETEEYKQSMQSPVELVEPSAAPATDLEPITVQETTTKNKGMFKRAARKAAKETKKSSKQSNQSNKQCKLSTAHFFVQPPIHASITSYEDGMELGLQLLMSRMGQWNDTIQLCKQAIALFPIQLAEYEEPDSKYNFKSTLWKHLFGPLSSDRLNHTNFQQTSWPGWWIEREEEGSPLYRIVPAFVLDDLLPSSMHLVHVLLATSTSSPCVLCTYKTSVTAFDTLLNQRRDLFKGLCLSCCRSSLAPTSLSSLSALQSSSLQERVFLQAPLLFCLYLGNCVFFPYNHTIERRMNYYLFHETYEPLVHFFV